MCDKSLKRKALTNVIIKQLRCRRDCVWCVSVREREREGGRDGGIERIASMRKNLFVVMKKELLHLFNWKHEEENSLRTVRCRD